MTSLTEKLLETRCFCCGVPSDQATLRPVLVLDCEKLACGRCADSIELGFPPHSGDRRRRIKPYRPEGDA